MLLVGGEGFAADADGGGGMGAVGDDGVGRLEDVERADKEQDCSRES